MKPINVTGNSSKSCSCTSCMYKSGSDNFSVKHLIAHGSKIDKLYYGKYIPLRERKLLDKLVRTREVYDDVRDRLLSGSNINIKPKTRLKPRKRVAAKKNLDDENKDSAIFTLVDLIDNGEHIDAKHSNECCSCCSCASDAKIQYPEKHNIHRHYHHHTRVESKMISEKQRDRTKSKKGLRFKSKNFRSDSCLCTLKFRRSKAIFSKIRQKRSVPMIESPTYMVEKSKFQKTKRNARSSYQKLKHSQTRLMRSMEKGTKNSLKRINQAKTTVKENVQLATRRSLEAIRNKKNKIKEKLGGIKSTLPTTKPSNVELHATEDMEDEQVFRIKKDSVTKFREKLERKRRLRDWECEPDCMPEECTPEQCFEKLKLRRLHRLRHVNKTQREASTRDTKHVKRKSKITSHNNKSVKSNTIITPTTSQMSSVSPKFGKKRSKNRRPVLIKQKSSCSCKNEVNEDKAITLIPENEKNRGIEKIESKKNEQNIRYGSKRPEILEIKKYENTSQINATLRSKERRKGSYGLKRCFCTLKLKTKNIKSKKTSEKKSQTDISKSEKPHRLCFLPNADKQPCITGVCNPLDCKESAKKHYSSQISTKRHSKSTSSLISKSHSSQSLSSGTSKRIKDSISSEIIPKRDVNQSNLGFKSTPPAGRRAVRISSSFEFKIEFLKDSHPDKVPNKNLDKTRNISPKKRKKIMQTSADKIIHKDKPRRKYIHRSSQNSSSLKSRYNLVKPDLRPSLNIERLKTAKNQTPKSVERFICDCPTTSQSVIIPIKKQQISRSVSTHRLEPYECEPGVCVPDKCDPYICEKLIKKRLRKQTITKHKLSNTFLATTRSTSSYSSIKPSKTKKIQSTVITYKTEVPSRKFEESELKSIKISKKPKQQAVRISSSFSFDIQFYKDKPQVNEKVERTSSKPEPKAILRNQHTKKRGRNLEIDAPSKSVAASQTKEKKIKAKGIHIGPVLKKCLCSFKFGKTTTQDNVSIQTEALNLKQKEQSQAVMATKSTKTKPLKAKCISKLKPYECEPFICIPGECDPVECFERINKRSLYHSKEFGSSTNNIEKKSISSSTYKSDKKSKSVLIQSNRIDKIQKTNNHLQKQSHRQATKIGSSFSFNIEIFKDSAIVNNVNSDGLRKKSNAKNVNIAHQKDIIIQSADIQTDNKASSVKPMLQRCFCTLKIAKKGKQSKAPTKSPKVYTVSRMFTAKTKINTGNRWFHKDIQNIGNERIATNYSAFGLSASNSNYSLNSMSLEDSLRLKPVSNKLYKKPPKQNVRIDSNFSFELEFFKNKSDGTNIENTTINKMVKRNDIYGDDYSFTHYRTLEMNNVYNLRNTVENPFLRRCYCTMNIQVPGREKKRRATHKLKPYECEPGICVPYECDPNECQKLIMKRYMKTSKTGTESSWSESKASNSPNFKPNLKERKLQSNRPRRLSKSYVEQSYKGVNYKSLPKNGRRQVVRIGSCFNFSIECSKSQPTTKVGKSRKPIVARSSLIIKNRGTRGRTLHFLNQDTQSATKMSDKGSFVKPKLNRCFCTLKLQKRGKLKEQQFNTKNDRGTLTPLDLDTKNIVKKTSDIGQNTKRNKTKRDILCKLDPSECEPGICIPEKCDPYKCLKIIKQRHRECGTDTLQLKTKSVSSLTSSGQETHFKSKQVQSRFNNDRKVVKTMQHQNPTYERDEDSFSIGSNKQAVRIGSNFSFNIEFFKETPITNNLHIKNNIFQEIPKPKTEENNNQVIKTKGKGLTTDSQTEIGKNKATDVSFLQRCFCTLKLQRKEKNKKIKHDNIRHVTKGTKTEFKKETYNYPTKSVMATAKVKAKNKEKRHVLESYECEPNVCIPGKCDPNECLKRIKNRQENYKQDTKGTITPTQGIKSIGSGREKERCSQRSKKVDAELGNRNDMTKLTSVYKEPKRSYESSNHRDKQAVRIGSTFSFNIEFSKSRNVNENLPLSHLVLDEKQKNVKTAKSQNQTINNRDKRLQVLDSKTQSKKTEVNTFLKRCFCTLKLQKENRERIDGKNAVTVGTETPKKMFKITPRQLDSKSKNVHTAINKKYKHLEPYECEPGFCFPYECDSYVCAKRIKERNKLKISKGSGNRIPKSRSTSTLTNQTKKQKIVKLQVNPLKHPKQSKERVIVTSAREVIPKNKYLEPVIGSNRQAVRIGSNFSFNIELFKERTPPVSDDVILNNVPKKNLRRTENKPKKRKDMEVGSKDVSTRNRQMQVINAKMENKMSGVIPILKRCFCTLKLHKIGEQQKKIETKETFTSTPKNMFKDAKFGRVKSVDDKRQRDNFFSLEEFECEPYSCVPGECDPYECEKRIKQRQMKKIGTKTYNPSKRSVGNSVNKRFRTRSIKTQISAKRKYPVQQNNSTYELPDHHIRLKEKPNRQVVRIGSNFSFDIEIFKERNPNIPLNKFDNVKISPGSKEKNKYKINTPKKVAAKSVWEKSRIDNQESQVIKINKESKGSEISPALKRCFCTLKFQKMPSSRSPVQKLVPIKRAKSNLSRNCECFPELSSRQKKTLNNTNQNIQVLSMYECEPHTRIAEYRNPNKCECSIKKRRLRRISRNKNTRIKRCSQVSVLSMASLLKPYIKKSGLHSKKSQYLSKREAVLVEQPRFANYFNKISNCQLVRIGSNISFSIELLKGPGVGYISQRQEESHQILEKRQPRSKMIKLDKNKLSRDQSSENKYRKNHVRNFKTNETTGFRRALKKCFCTLKLQKFSTGQAKISNKGTAPSDTPWNKKPKFATLCNTVAVQEFRNIPMRKPPIQNRTLQNEKISCKNFEKGDCFKSQFQRSFCVFNCDCTNDLLLRKKNIFFGVKSKRKDVSNTDMETIYPYTPRKFNKKPSKTIISTNVTKTKNKTTPKCCLRCDCKRYDCRAQQYLLNTEPKFRTHNKGKVLFNHRNLTRKKSVNSIQHITFKPNDSINKDKQKRFDIKSFILCKCKQIFSYRRSPITKPECKSTNHVSSFENFQGIDKKEAYILQKISCKKKNSNQDNITDDLRDKGIKANQNYKCKSILCKRCYTANLTKQHLNPFSMIQNNFKKEGFGKKPILKKRNERRPNFNSGDYVKTDKNREPMKKVLKCTPSFCKQNLANKKKEKDKEKRTALKKYLSFTKSYDTKPNSQLSTPMIKVKTGKSKKARVEKPFVKTDVLKGSKSDRRHNSFLKINVIPKKTKSLKVTKVYENKSRNDEYKLKYSLFQSGDARQNVVGKLLPENKAVGKTRFKSKYTKKSDLKYTTCMCLCCQANKHGRKENLSKEGNIPESLQSYKTKFKIIRESGAHKSNTVKIKNSKKPKVNINEIALKQPCDLCRSYFNHSKKEKNVGKSRLASGDGPFMQKNIKKKKPTTKKSLPQKVTKAKKEKPLFKIKVASESFTILNKEEIAEKVLKLDSKKKVDEKKKIHGEDCRCCICLGKKKKMKGHDEKLVCPCSKVKVTSQCFDNLIKSGKKFISSFRNRQKPCICGSPVCMRETKKIQDKKRRSKKKGIDLELKKLRLGYRKEDVERKKKLLKEDKHLNKMIKKNKRAGSYLLAFDSLVDIGRLGATGVGSLLRCTSRTIKDPKGLTSHLKEAYSNSGVTPTAQRVKKRLKAMACYSKLQNKMEQNAVTNFIWNINHKDPKKKMRPKKKIPRRVREPLDFGCSLFMGSLRKRPCLAVYYTCPWFYPHCLSLLTVWRQFADVMLFLLAVVVWSPCIIGMEICRAIMCCFFCTG